MKTTIYIFLLVIIGSCESKAQSNDVVEEKSTIEVNINDYIIFNEGDTRIYKCQHIPPQIITNGVSNNYTDIVTTFDTSIIKSIEIDGLKHFYTWENDPPYYNLFFNSILGGLSISKEDGLHFATIDKEGDLLSIPSDSLKLLFPNSIKKGVDYNTLSQYGNTITYRLVDNGEIQIEGIRYINTITVTRTTYYDDSESIDSLWLAPKLGLVRLKKSTGRTENLTSFEPAKDQNKVITELDNGILYTNSSGVVVKESQLTDAYKVEGDYSTPTYNKNGYLVKEDFWGKLGEMGIEYITYNYDEKNNLIEELYYYDSRKNSSGEIVFKIWINQYEYSQSNHLIGSKHKMDSNDAEYYKTNSFREENKVDVSKLLYSKRHKIKY